MKKFFTLALALSVWAGAMAVPARPRTNTITLDDGSTLTVTKVGDEWHHRTLTTDGKAVARAADGKFYYIGADGKRSNVPARDAAFRTASEQAFLQSLNSLSTVNSKAVKRAKTVAKRNDGRRRASQVPNLASPRVPIVLVQFSDVKFSKPDTEIKSYYETQMNEKGGVSCYQYFVDQSEGKYTPQFDILGPVTISKRATYGGNDSDGNDQGLGQFVKDAVAKLPNVDWSLYDNNKDGEVDVIVLQYAGVGEASSYEDESIWPCQWSVYEATCEWEYNDLTDDWDLVKEGAPINVNGYTIDKFAVFNEMNGTYDDEPGDIDGVGTFCHEFSHCLGLPDFYDVDYAGHFGMGNWSCLDGGCNNNLGYTPCGYTAYEKEFMGWKQTEEAVQGTTYSLEASVLTTGKGIKIISDSDPNEYYILENRQLSGWDAYLPNHGLMITHVYYDETAWAENTVNSTDTRRMTIIPADNSLKMDRYQDETGYYYMANEEDQVGDLFPYKGNNELTDDSKPAATLYTGSKLMGKPITNIADANGIVTFNFMKGILNAPVLNEAADITATSFTASWSEVEDATSYTLRVREKDANEAELLIEENCSEFSGNNGTDYGESLDDWMANAGWTGTKVYLENCLRLATGKVDGTLVSPVLNVGDAGKITVAINACSYGTDGNISLKVETSQANSTLDFDSSASTAYVVLDAASSEQLKITATKKQRPQIYSIAIYSGDASEMLGNPDYVPAGETFTFDVEGTTYTVTGLTPEATYYFDVMAVNADTNSKYSNRQLVILLASSGNVYDLNDDGNVNAGDVSTLYEAILAGASDAKFDLNGDGNVNVGDVATLYGVILNGAN